jgi:Outer membrane protein beta-barrel domain
MKKIIMSMALGFASYASAQEVNFAVKGGLNSSSIKGPMGLGAYVGASARMALNQKLSIQPELLYSFNQGNYNYNGDGILEARNYKDGKAVYNNYRYDYRHKISYHALAVPILLNYQIHPKIQIFAGPQINYMLSNRNHFSYWPEGQQNAEGNFSFEDEKMTVSLDQDTNLDTDTDFKPQRLHLGLVLGGSYDVDDHFFVEARCHVPISSFVKNANITGMPIRPNNNTEVTLDNGKKNIQLSNTNIQLGLGYRF